jgi:hypothetical protein
MRLFNRAAKLAVNLAGRIIRVINLVGVMIHLHAAIRAAHSVCALHKKTSLLRDG